jgi:hypothetical protein
VRSRPWLFRLSMEGRGREVMESDLSVCMNH